MFEKYLRNSRKVFKNLCNKFSVPMREILENFKKLLGTFEIRF